jgi:hypothetical protein
MRMNRQPGYMRTSCFCHHVFQATRALAYTSHTCTYVRAKGRHVQEVPMSEELKKSALTVLGHCCIPYPARNRRIKY